MVEKDEVDNSGGAAGNEYCLLPLLELVVQLTKLDVGLINNKAVGTAVGRFIGIPLETSFVFNHYIAAPLNSLLKTTGSTESIAKAGEGKVKVSGSRHQGGKH